METCTSDWRWHFKIHWDLNSSKSTFEINISATYAATATQRLLASSQKITYHLCSVALRKFSWMTPLYAIDYATNEFGVKFTAININTSWCVYYRQIFENIWMLKLQRRRPLAGIFSGFGSEYVQVVPGKKRRRSANPVRVESERAVDYTLIIFKIRKDAGRR